LPPVIESFEYWSVSRSRFSRIFSSSSRSLAFPFVSFSELAVLVRFHVSSLVVLIFWSALEVFFFYTFPFFLVFFLSTLFFFLSRFL